MLKIVEGGEDDGLGNITPEGCVCIVGVKYALRVGPGSAEPEDEGRLWYWEIAWPYGPNDPQNIIECADKVQCARDNLIRVAWVCARNAVRQLASEAAGRQQNAEEFPRPNFQFDIDDAATNAARAWKAAQVYGERAEWVASVEHFLWFELWQTGVVD